MQEFSTTIDIAAVFIFVVSLACELWLTFGEWRLSRKDKSKIEYADVPQYRQL